MQPPIDIPIPRQTSSFHSLDSSVVVGSPLGESHVDDFASTTPVSSSRNTFRSRRRVPSASQPNQWPLEPTRQWSLFGQLMEIEGHLPSSTSSTPRRGRTESDADISVREHVSSSPGLSPRIRPSTSYDASFPTHPTTSDLASNPNNYEPDSLSSSAATFEVPSKANQSYLPFRLPTFTIIHRNVLKCAIAYFVASLFTFSPHLSRFISDLSLYGPNDRTTPSPSGHMVATM
jgi:hypothetical protein